MVAEVSPSTTPVPDRGQSLIVLMWVLTALSSVTVAARFTFRARKAILGWDDLFMLLSVSCFYGYSIVLTMLCLKGGERHFSDVVLLEPDIIAQIQLFNWTSQVFAIIGIGAGKVSVAALLLAILEDTHGAWQKTYLWTFCIVLVCGVSVSCSILTMAQCTPAAALWDLRVVGKCINPKVMADYGTFAGAYNTFVDASLALIPSTIFWSLQMSFSDKLTLSIVFSLNILTSICSGIKTSFLSSLANRTDLTWATYDIFAWVTAEFFLIIVCSSIPTLKPILNLFRRGIIKSKHSKNTYERHTGDSAPPVSDELQLNGFRRDVQRSETSVSVLGHGGSNKRAAGLNEIDIVVDKSYKIGIETNDSQQELIAGANISKKL